MLRTSNDRDDQPSTSGKYESLCSSELQQNTYIPMCPQALRSMLYAFRSGKTDLSSSVFRSIVDRAAEMLRSQPNIVELHLKAGEAVTVCGDLHGNLPALLQFFDQNDLPLPSNIFIFNGDFVDRGKNSVQVLALILASYVAFPDCVILNRGNHEDIVVNQQYGFRRELANKYPEQCDHLLQACSEAFRQIPLACIVNKAVLICHGGLSPLIELERLQRLDRSKFVSILSPCLEGPDAVDAHDWQQVLNLLWSDPQEKFGYRPNTFRGGGCCFGPDITEAFVRRTGIELIVRSHECVPEGWKLTHSGAVLTIFSSFDYLGHETNKGAMVRLSVLEPEELRRADYPSSVVATLAPIPLPRAPLLSNENHVILPQIMLLPKQQVN